MMKPVDPLGRRNADAAEAFRWATGAAKPAVRGNRITAWEICMKGVWTIDGASTLKEAARRRGMSESTMFEILRTLRLRFGLEPMSGEPPSIIAQPERYRETFDSEDDQSEPFPAMAEAS